jgi:RNA polymerase sigma-70 factor (ECF subfamily)
LAWHTLDELAEPAAEPPASIDEADLRKALAELPESFRTPVILYYFADLSYRDIAEQMGLPMGTVMSRLARAKSHLRCRLLEPQRYHPVSAQRRASNGL